MKRKLALLLSVIMVATMLFGCAPKTDTPQGEDKPGTSTDPGTTQPEQTAGGKPIDKITFAVGMDADTLDAQKINIERSGEIAYYIYSNLLRSAGGKIENDIAESYTVSEDGLVYTFKLRDAKWADGEPVTAEHFRYAVERLLDPNTASSQADSYYYIKNAEKFNKGEVTADQLGVKAIDEKTYEMTLEYAHPYLLTALSVDTCTYPVRKDVVEKHGANYGSSIETVMCNGPYTLTKWAAESEIVMTKNDSYWNADTITVKEIVRLTVADANTRMAMFDNGEIDCTNETVANLVGNYPDAVQSLTASIRSLQLNVNGKSEETRAIMQNKNFAKALSYAIDRAAFTNAVIGTTSQPINRFAYPVFNGANGGKYVDEYPLENLVPLEGDKEKAVEYFELALTETGLTRETFPTLNMVTFDNTFKAQAEAYIDTFRQVLGITMELSLYPIPVAIQNCAERNYDIYLQSYSVGIDPYDYLSSWITTGGVNWTGWSDAEFDKMIEDSKYIADQDERYKLLQKAEQYLLENGPQIPIHTPGGYYLLNEEIQGYYNGDGGSGKQQFQHCTTKN